MSRFGGTRWPRWMTCSIGSPLEIAERDALIAELAQGATVSQRLLESTASARAAEQPIAADDSASAPPPLEFPPSTIDNRRTGQRRDN